MQRRDLFNDRKVEHDEEIYERLVRSICFDMCLLIHRDVKTSNSFALLSSPPTKKAKVDSSEGRSYTGSDIYGNFPNSNEVNSKCLSCGRHMAVVTFARHLDKCLGIGSTSRSSATINHKEEVKDSTENLTNKYK